MKTSSIKKKVRFMMEEQHLLDDEPFELVSMRFPQFPIAIASLIMDECLDNRRGGSLIQTRIPDPLSLTSSYGPEME